jgi:AmmeMemoRadiSam system protein B/AmmeMemoRadiSam system protein A
VIERALAILFLLPVLVAAAGDAPAPREPAVAGRFYPAEPDRLEAAVRGFLADAVPPRGEVPVGLVVPHAGIIYSGQIAADGWRQAMAATYDLVVILGTNHTTAAFDGVSIYAGPGFKTPLGVAEVDTALAKRLIDADPAFVFDNAVHRAEHSIEVQVPFVQVALPGVKILPAIVGISDPDLCDRFGRGVLIVASSDLSHYPAYDDARASDAAVLSAIASLEPATLRRTIAAEMGKGRRDLVTCACGEAPILAAMAAVKALGATHGVVLSWANSGDTAVGDHDRVVGYGAVELVRGPGGPDASVLAAKPAPPAEAPLGPAEGQALVAFARKSIGRVLASDTAPLARGLPPALDAKRGVFVTLYEGGELRGCVGRLEGDLPLGQATGLTALRAAFADSRFTPLRPGELSKIEIEVSVLTPYARVAGPEAITIGKDGVLLRKSGRAAVYLPEVAVEQGWGIATLLDHLSVKAGLAADAWKAGAELYTFQTTRFEETARR